MTAQVILGDRGKLGPKQTDKQTEKSPDLAKKGGGGGKGYLAPVEIMSLTLGMGGVRTCLTSRGGFEGSLGTRV